MSRNKPFILSTEVDGATIGFGLHRGVAWIQITEAMGNVTSTTSAFHYDSVVKRAVELLNPDLWPAFADKFKPVVEPNYLF